MSHTRTYDVYNSNRRIQCDRVAMERRSADRGVRRKIRVKSRFRFITFLVIVIGLFIGTVGMLTGMDESTASMTSDYISYTVASGDTLWDIANTVNHNAIDNRRIVHAICLINEIQADQLQPGMVLTIPTNM